MWTKYDFDLFFKEVKGIDDIDNLRVMTELVAVEGVYEIEVSCWIDHAIHYFEITVTEAEMKEWSMNRRGSMLGEGVGILDIEDTEMRRKNEYWLSGLRVPAELEPEPILNPVEKTEKEDSVLVKYFKALWQRITYRKPYF